MNNLVHIVPFEDELKSNSWFYIISTKIKDLILSSSKHPKILVPFTPNEL
jgi:hypothetical protein